MNFKRTSALVGVLAVGTMTLAACGSDDNATAGGSDANTSVDCGGKKALKASGASSQKNAMERFVAAYEQNCDGYTLNYTSSGSGAGVNEFIGAQTDFGGSDSALSSKKEEPAKAQERCGAPAWNLPTVFGPIAITYNVDGVTDLVLDGPTAAKVFNGSVATWDAPEIKALNPNAKLPSEKIAVIFRSDESGTTDNFQLYLDAASDGAWGKGGGKTFNGGVGEGAKGNEGTSAAIKNTKNSITYNEWSFAKAQNLSIAQIITSASKDPVKLSAETAAKSIDGVKVKGEGNDLVLDTSSFYKPTVAGSYPIMMATYEIVCSKYADADTSKAVKAFLTSVVTNGQNGLADAGYVPLPDAFKTKLTTAINAIS
ncbi:phosphate ABC transporter substrate-binding protein PstS [Nocardia asteroides]|uniref:Phosphate-binding protein n=1 Tax=Nocardia asteroides NBRC 15531 TaxID=1110697 RepID=U5E8V1_NOCAS|nr:phosphate ABC transporter substrate-binding protein PstS [Nocardia asteroides]TLF65279.1 phosphate ABC transporter substrate-binding protein PstS [Nocardia asteroides NBRC 15531]UGT47978.1 phosphate ABC transporter substrate-binding protein PstS [Nocardia asteroides]SFM61151.1 phosphate ABC transporter substrate-binding protein, PhoT family [Nocardia asteroides]VEG33085.1 Antigen Ag88 [Nocardia asteroides]GAD82866.1 phosphate ABC transporter substrate-binding protein [Nocardia asteroides NB